MLFNRSRPKVTALPRLQAPVAVIGDVHGRDDLLEALLVRLAADPEAREMRVICVGDMVDRGPGSAGVLRRLQALAADPGPFASLTCLMGNHDRMLLDFLDRPAEAGPRWLHYGGAETLESFGVSPTRAASTGSAGDRLQALAEGLRDKMGALPAWMASLPLRWCEETLWVIHAGAHPRKDPARQSDHACLWGEPAFYTGARRDDLWVAHGHTIVGDPVAQGGRITVDTGAWRTGRLTAAVLAEGAVRFVST